MSTKFERLSNFFLLCVRFSFAKRYLSSFTMEKIQRRNSHTHAGVAII